MSSIVLAGRSCRCGATILQSNFLSTKVQSARAASLNSAIGRGLRKSKGVGFRGKERSQEGNENGANNDSRESSGFVRRTVDPPLSIPNGRLTYDAWRKGRDPLQWESGDKPRANNSRLSLRRGDGEESQARLPTISRHDRHVELNSRSSTARLRRGKKDITEDDTRPKRRSRAGRFNDPDYNFGKRALERRAARLAKTKSEDNEWDPLTRKLRLNDGEDSPGRRRPTMTSAARRAVESDRIALERNPGGSKLSKGRQAYLSRVAESSPRIASEEEVSRLNSEFAERGQGYSHRDNKWSPVSMEGRHNRESRPVRDNEAIRSAPRMATDRLPLSIPYTTPASEFLYGTSVVEAALRSRREPRRKLYKLYVYKGENRESGDGQDAIERLAKKNNVSIVHHTESPRLLDKMSAGRPHNGYILEASPLPQPPLTSLGSLTADGFEVNLDHQSREEAAINGTSPFIPLPGPFNRQSRKPLILFLDSILDPGNLGGIIRTASFLGITAIALSTRNSASLSPIVLKASAGASESVTLFAVNKPAGFITDSKRAGWKVYAAVAPRAPPAPAQGPQNRRASQRLTPPSRSSSSDSNSSVPAITTDDLLLSNPLSHDPCILMLGNEGEGLRWNLRSKADVELSIPGSPHRGGVDSLNVSVAAGVMCQAFLSRVGATSRVGGVTRGDRDAAEEEMGGGRPTRHNAEAAAEKALDLF